MTKPKILVFDIETAPVLAWIWRTGRKININHDQIKSGQKFDIICICYKWLGEKKIHALDWGLKRQDSSSMIAEFTKVVEAADLVIGHNSDRFDIRQINSQRLLHGQDPINWPASEDTLKQFRKHFAFPSYKLDYLSKILVGKGKGDMHFQDWIDIVENKSAKALDKMIKYCKKDVLRLEQVFKKAFRHFTPKINMSLVARGDRGGCPRCGSANVKRSGTRTTMAGKYREYRCNECARRFKGEKLPNFDTFRGED